MFEKVIWATDGSEHADRAMPRAIQLAADNGGELHVVHVVEKLMSARASGLDAFANEDQVKARVERQAKSIATENGVKATIHIVVGLSNHTADRIADVATDTGADVIVVGTRGHGPLGSLVLGSVTQRLLHVSPCPVLAVPPSVGADVEGSAEPTVAIG